MINKHVDIYKIFLALILIVGLVTINDYDVRATPDGMVFPVVGNTNYSDTFLAYRAGQVQNKHHAIDIFGAKHSSIISPVDGTMRYVGYPQDSWGWYVVIVDKDGYEYHFMHINNDTPGTDDGNGGPMQAYGPDVRGEYNEGANKATPVTKGQHIAYLGDSGNAENTPPHLHFEIIKPEYTQIDYRSIPIEGFVNPFSYLNLAPHYQAPSQYPTLKNENLPYGPSVGSAVNLATGNFDGDADDEYVTGAGPGGGPHIRLFDKDNSFLQKEFMAFSPNFFGGVDVGAGDVDGDGIDEIIVAAQRGGGPHVRVLKTDGTEIGGFYAYDAKFTGGVRVAAGDVDGDGLAEIVTGIESGGGPHVRVFKANGQVVSEFYAYAPNYYGGVDVAVGDVINNSRAEVVTGAGPGGGPHVRIFDGSSGQSLNSGFMAYENFISGVRIGVTRNKVVGNKSNIVTAPWKNGGPHIRELTASGVVVSEEMYIEEWWNGSYDITGSDNYSLVGTGSNRRTSVKQALTGQ